MNKSSSSASSSSPPFTTLPPPPKSTVNLTRLAPSVIPLEYDYRSIMSPSSLTQLRKNTTTVSNATRSSRPRTATSSTRQADINENITNEYSSLFGEPVPPPSIAATEPSEYLGTNIFARPRTSVEINAGSSEDENGFGRTATLEKPHRLFSNVPYTSLLRRRSSNASTEHNFDVLPVPLPRLQPPDIQILPNSSGGSSSEHQDSPNYALLNSQQILRRPTLYNLENPADVTELSETVTINDASGVREYTEASRRLSNFDNVNSIDSPPFPEETPLLQHLGRQFSDELYVSADWFRTSMNDFPEFTKMPKLRPSSKNVMSIKRDEMPTQHSPVAAMINDSNGSSSGGEERLLNITQTLSEPTVPLDILAPRRPPEPSTALLRDLETGSQKGTPQRRRLSSVGSTGTIFSPSPPAAPPPPVPPEQDLQLLNTNERDETTSIKREMSPVILRDSIVTGGDYRVDQIRLHKKTSFTIITDRSPHSSRAQTPTNPAQKHMKAYTDIQCPAPTLTPTPTMSSNVTSRHPIPQPRHHPHQSHQNNLQRKSLTSMQLRLPQLIPPQFTSDDSPRPSVQFDMSGRYSPSKMPQKSILHQRESLSSSQETPLSLQEKQSKPPPVPVRRASVLQTADSFESQRKMRSYETLPIITDPYRTAIPRRLHRSSLDIFESAAIPPGALPRPLRPNPNPTRTQRGLLRVINSAESVSRIPRSNWTSSMDDITLKRKPTLTPLRLQMRRRSSSTSPSRRSSTQTASDRRSSNLSSVTTSDFSFRRPSLTNIPTLSRERRKSIFSSANTTTTPKRRKSIVGGGTNSNKQRRGARSKIAKPSTLSPIIGTPNKDSSSTHSPAHFINHDALLNASETMSDTTSRRESVSRIPIRSDANSRSNSRMSTHADSRGPSRMSSPLKEFTAQLPLSDLTSSTNSRSPSRATMHSESRPVSRADSRAHVPSRSTSRASTRPLSRGAPSRGGSRAGSRFAESRVSIDSRPNSRLEQARNVANSRSNSRLSHRTRSPLGRVTSVSPNAGRHQRVKAMPGRRKSVSLSPKFNRKSAPSKRSQSPTSKKRGGRSDKPLERRLSRSRIPTRAKSDLSGRTPRSPKKSKPTVELKRTASARKATTTPLGKKQPTSAKKAPASVRKPESSVKQAASSASKPTSVATKKQATPLKRKATNIQGKSTTVPTTRSGNATDDTKSAPKHGASAMDLKKKTGTDAKQLKKQTSGKQLVKAADAKTSSTATGAVNGGKSAGDGSSGSRAKATETKEPEAAIELSPATIEATASATGALISGMKKPPSTMTLLRMGSRLSLLSKKRPDSSLGRHITEESEESSEPSAQATNATAAGAALHKVSSSGQLITPDGLPAVILEKSQKTLENVQKTVTVATDEIQRTLHENISDLKNLEHDVGRISDGATSTTPSVTTVLENKAGSQGGTASGSGLDDRSPQPSTQPIEASVSVLNAANESGMERVSASTAMSVLPEVDCESANFQNYELGIEDKQAGIGSGSKAVEGMDGGVGMSGALTDEPSTSSGVDGGISKQRRSPDGQGGSTAGSGAKRTGSRELLEDPDEKPPKGCCRCCARFCMPCRRARCSRCCRRGKAKTGTDDADERPVLSATSSTTTTNLEVIDEITGKKKKNGCWQRMNCFKKKSKNETNEIIEQPQQQQQMEGQPHPQGPISATTSTTPKQGKCGACLRKVFCCRSANKVETTKHDDTDVEKGNCCACLPCLKKKSTTPAGAWHDPEQTATNAEATVLEGAEGAASTAATPAPDGEIKEGCCKRFWRRICCCCCRKKPPAVPAGSRRASIKPPPVEDTRRKLHVDLVEFTSKMKGAIPVLPLFLAWFCLICNIVIPGLGTLFSGIFCICVGIPRFSQYDSAKARLGSFIINTIVATAQLFCVLFCFVGWGWSIWWGTIMLKCAKKLKKIRKVERLEMEEEQRQAAAAAEVDARAAVVYQEPVKEVTKT